MELTRHHILPRRFFGNKKNSPILHLCRKCHDDIELLLPQEIKMTRSEYVEIAVDFLTPDSKEV
jgi:hypothetical protein